MFIILCFSACVSLYSVVLLIFEYRIALLDLLFENFSCNSNDNGLGLSVRIKISTYPCKLVGLLPSMDVYMIHMDLSLLCVKGGGILYSSRRYCLFLVPRIFWILLVWLYFVISRIFCPWLYFVFVWLFYS